MWTAGMVWRSSKDSMPSNPVLTDHLPRSAVLLVYAGMREEYCDASGARALATRDLRLARRITRDYLFRGHDAGFTLNLWPARDQLGKPVYQGVQGPGRPGAGYLLQLRAGALADRAAAHGSADGSGGSPLGPAGFAVCPAASLCSGFPAAGAAAEHSPGVYRTRSCKCS